MTALTVKTSRAQIIPTQSELSVSGGLYSLYASLGAQGESGEYTYLQSPNWFVTYRYYLTTRVAIGVALGTQQYSGAYLDDGGGTRYYFQYHCSTLAAECLFNYTKTKLVRTYTYVGVGISGIGERQTADSYYYHNNSNLQYGRQVIQFGFNFQCVPLGISIGDKISVFGELGIGKQGFVEFPVCPYHFKQASHHIIPPGQQVMLLPRDAPLKEELKGRKLTFMETIDTKKAAHRHPADFNTQLNDISAMVRAKEGNVFRVTRIKENNQYTTLLKGRVFYTGDFEDLQAKVSAARNKVFTEAPGACIVIYNPGRRAVTLTAKGSNIVVKGRSKCVLKIADKGNYEIAARNNTVHLDLQPSHYYYVKVFPTYKWVNINTVDELQGELESSFLSDATNESRNADE